MTCVHALPVTGGRRERYGKGRHCGCRGKEHKARYHGIVWRRERTSLNGPWNIVVDEHSIGAQALFDLAYFTSPPELTRMEPVEFSLAPPRQLQVLRDFYAQKVAE